MQHRKYGNILHIVLLFTIFSCNYLSQEEINNFDKDERLVSFFTLCGIPVDSSTVFIIPPTSCKQCQKGGLKELNNYKYCYILYPNIDKCDAVFPTQKCIAYDGEKMREKGLDNVYSEVIKIRNAKIVFRKALFN